MQGNCTVYMMEMSDQVDLLLTDFKDFCYTELETNWKINITHQI